MPNVPNAADQSINRLRTMNPLMASITNRATDQADLRDSDRLWAELDSYGNVS